MNVCFRKENLGTADLDGCANATKRTCGYFIERKKRCCRMSVGRGAQFCGEHGDGERVPCPLDPRHSCFRATLQKHLSKCNARPQDGPAFLVPRVNATPTLIDSSPLRTLADFSDPELLELCHRIEYAVTRMPPCNTSVLIHEAVAGAIEAPDCGIKARKHLVQNASLLANIEAQGFLSDGSTFIEFGAGRGQLSFWLGEVLQKNNNCSLLLVDRASTRHKLDNKLKDGNVPVTRVRADIADLDLARLVAKDARVVGICKHLCGEATDLSLQCLLRAAEAGLQVAGLVMAPCCHHRCTWHNFLGHDYLKEMGFSEQQFSAICGISSWATCGTGRPRARQSPTEARCLDDTLHLDRYTRLDMNQKTRERIGRMAKMVLNYARLKHVEARGLKGQLFYYTDTAVSPENVCFIAKPFP